jgi:hypothetical protein
LLEKIPLQAKQAEGSIQAAHRQKSNMHVGFDNAFQRRVHFLSFRARLFLLVPQLSGHPDLGGL